MINIHNSSADPSVIATHHSNAIESIKTFQGPGLIRILIRFKSGVSTADRKNIAENIMKDVCKDTFHNISGIKKSYYKTRDDEDWTEAISMESAVKEYGVFRKIMVGGAFFVLTKRPRDKVGTVKNPDIYFSPRSFPTVISAGAPSDLIVNPSSDNDVNSTLWNDKSPNVDCVISFFYPAEIVAFLPLNVTIIQNASIEIYGGMTDAPRIRISKWFPFP